MKARNLALAVAVTGILALASVGLRAQAGRQTNTPQKNWRDRAEYDLYDAILKDQNPRTRLEKLNQWEERYPSTDYISERRALFLTTRTALGQVQEAQSSVTQPTTGDYERPLNLARGYMRERRFQDAIGAFTQAYQARPSAAVLAELVPAYIALGMSTEAEDVASQVFTQGGEIALQFRHNHSRAYCFGTLFVSPQRIRWVGQDRNEGFQVSPSEIEKIQISESDDNGGGFIPELRLRTLNKNWLYEYLLYGPGQYQTSIIGQIVYSEAERQNAQKATALIVRLLARASSMPAVTQRQPVHAPGEDEQPTLQRRDAAPPTEPVAHSTAISDSPLLLKQDPQWSPKDEAFSKPIGNRDFSRNARISLEQEIAIGRSLAGEVERQIKLNDDPFVTEYVNRVGQNLVRNSEAKVPFTIKVVDTDVVGVWPLPGGFLFVSSGLVLAAGSESELAFALAHAIGHIAARHYARFGPRVSATSLPEFSKTAFPIAAEAEADFLGLEYMYKAGYDPSASQRLAENIRGVFSRQSAPFARSSSMHVILTPRRVSAINEEAAPYLLVKPEYVISTSELEVVQRRLTSKQFPSGNEAGADKDVAGGPPTEKQSSGQPATASTQLRVGQTLEEVEKLMGKLEEWTRFRTYERGATPGERLMGRYPTGDVVFDNGKLASYTPTAPQAERKPSAQQAAPAIQLQEGQTPEEVEKLMGKPNDTISLQESLIYIYPTVKVIFKSGKLVDVQ